MDPDRSSLDDGLRRGRRACLSAVGFTTDVALVVVYAVRLPHRQGSLDQPRRSHNLNSNACCALLRCLCSLPLILSEPSMIVAQIPRHRPNFPSGTVGRAAGLYVSFHGQGSTEHITRSCWH